MTGTLPLELGHLIGLEHLILKNNPDLTGWLPETLAHIKSLSQLGLYKNALSGTIPDIFQHANQIRYINLEDNHMHGSIPLNIKLLTNLDTLALANNKFDGMVPIAALAQTTLKYLSLSGNEFSSMLDHSIGDMTTMEHMYLDHNKIKGTADVICNNTGANIALKYFVADCEGPNPNIECGCCDLCCNDLNATCNNLGWSLNMDPIWEYGYERLAYKYSNELIVGALDVNRTVAWESLEPNFLTCQPCTLSFVPR